MGRRMSELREASGVEEPVVVRATRHTRKARRLPNPFLKIGTSKQKPIKLTPLQFYALLNIWRMQQGSARFNFQMPKVQVWFLAPDYCAKGRLLPIRARNWASQVRWLKRHMLIECPRTEFHNRSADYLRPTSEGYRILDGLTLG